MDVNPGVSFVGFEEVLNFLKLLEELFSGGLSFRIALFAIVAWCLWQR